MQFVILSSEFYQKHKQHKEILKKADRPYCVVVIEYNQLKYAIPLRSHIKHSYAFFTQVEKDNINGRRGLDFTKTVVIYDDTDINTHRRGYVQEEDYKALLGKEYLLKKNFVRFLKIYENALAHPERREYQSLLSNCSLQYFY